METGAHFAATAAIEVKIFCRSASPGHLAPKEVLHRMHNFVF